MVVRSKARKLVAKYGRNFGVPDNQTCSLGGHWGQRHLSFYLDPKSDSGDNAAGCRTSLGTQENCQQGSETAGHLLTRTAILVYAVAHPANAKWQATAVRKVDGAH